MICGPGLSGRPPSWERKIARPYRWGIWAAPLFLLFLVSCSSNNEAKSSGSADQESGTRSVAGKAAEGKAAYRWAFRTAKEPAITAGGVFVDSDIDLRELGERFKSDFKHDRIVSVKVYDDPMALSDRQGRDFGWIAWYSKNMQNGIHKLEIAAKEGRKAETIEY